MIHNVLPVMVDELNQYISLNYHVEEDKAILSNLVSQDGQVVMHGENKIICSLVNIEEERIYKVPNGSFKMGGSFGSTPAPLNLNLYVLFAANFTGNNYAEALKFLSATLAFFQSKPVFDRQNTPLLSVNAEKLSLELVNMTYQELTNFWSVIGAKYMPSVLYKIRMITIHEDMVKEEIPAVRGLSQDLES